MNENAHASAAAPRGLDHEQAAALLPWLVNETLDGSERARVEAHVRACLVCRAELKAQRALRELVQQQPTVPLSAEEGYARLQGLLSRRSKARIAAAPRVSRPAAALAAALSIAVVGATWLGWRATSRDGTSPDYATLTAPAAAPAAAARVDVVFTPATTEPQLRALLGALRATIVDGPTEVGRYTLLVPLDAVEEAEVEALLRRLRDDPRVRFASRSFLPATPAEAD